VSNVDITWDDERFQRHLAYIREQLDKSILETLQNGAQWIVDIASKTAPKRYGFLRASIGKTDPSLITGSPKNAPELKGVWREEKDADGASIEVGSGMKYARYCEYYQAQSSLATGKRKLVMMREGRSPYLAPAFAQAIPEIKKDLQDLLKRVLNEKG
jgi:hypothetical protein